MLEHGTFEIRRQGNIVIIEVVGTFNIQAAQRGVDELKAACLAVDGGFYLLDLAKDFTDATPEVF